MRKIFLIVMILVLSLSAFGSGKQDKPVEISVLMAGNPEYSNGKTMFGIAVEKLKVDYPDVTVNMNIVDLSDGSTLTIDAMLAAGTPPNVYMDFIGRTGKYMVPEYALPLNDYVSDLDAYMPGMIDPLKTDGKVLGLPTPGGVYAMCINLDLLDEVGYKLPAVEDWTIDEFLKMCEMVKAGTNGEKYGTGMFAANQSGDYLINNWFASFGCEYYRDGYDHTTIKETGGKKVYELFQLLNEKGYIPKNSGVLADDDYVKYWYRGELAATGFFEGWTQVYFDAGATEGFQKFNYTFYPFPKAEGVDKVPAYFINHTVVVYNSEDEKVNEVAAKFAEYVNGVEIQELASEANVCMTRTDGTSRALSPMIPVISKIGEDNGIFDVGLSQSFYARVRPKHFPILQKVLNGEYTPEEAITEYEKAINEEL